MLSREQQQTLIETVEYLLDHPDLDAEALHLWRQKELLDKGWVYKEKCDPTNRIRILLANWSELLEGERIETRLFLGIVRAFQPWVDSWWAAPDDY